MDNEIYKSLIISQLKESESTRLMRKKMEWVTKSLENSEAMRKKGNDLYGKKCWKKLSKKIFELYTKSIACAPSDSAALALAYGNRSAFLCLMKRYKESILDIDRALKINKVDVTYQLKLLCRKVACLAAQDSPNTKNVYNELESLSKSIELSDSMLKNINKAKDKLGSLNKSNSPKIKEIPEHMNVLFEKEAQDPFDCVDIRYNKEFGKYLVSTRDIQPGEIIFVEKSHLKFMEQDNFLNHCGHCFVKSWANIPCDYCNWCMFCSEECKKLAWANYHDIECKTISQLQHDYEIDTFDRISLRSLLMRIKELGSIEKFKTDDLHFVDEFIDCHTRRMLVAKHKSLNPKLIKAALNSYHMSKKESLTKYAFTAAIILIILTKYTLLFQQSGEFKNINDLQRNEDVIFIGLVFLRLREISEYCTHIIHNENSVQKVTKDYMICKASNCHSKDDYIPKISSFILHSCNPNTQLCETNDQKLIVFALQPIKKNSPLFLAYSRWFFQPVEDSWILENIKSTCRCEACTQNWPNMIQLYKMPKDKPDLYAKSYNKKESELHDANNSLVSPIISGKKFQFNQSTIRRLAKAIEVASEYLKQPSIVICELLMCLNITFNRLYSTEKLC